MSSPVISTDFRLSNTTLEWPGRHFCAMCVERKWGKTKMNWWLEWASVGTCRQAGGDSTGQGLRWEKQVALYISGQQQWLCSDQKASGGGAHTAILCLVFVFNINTSDLLYFDIMLLKTPDLCNLRTFVAIFFLSRFTHIFRQFLEAKKRLCQFIHF